MITDLSIERVAIAEALARGEAAAALDIAMKATVRLYEASQFDREHLWNQLFHPIDAAGIATYQCSDFEIVDYEMAEFAGLDDKLFRGPVPSEDDIKNGNYICLAGAAQFFGRFHQLGLQNIIAEQTGIPVLNLSLGGVGAQQFLEAPYTRLFENARCNVIQVLSARSIGCDEYPGDWQVKGRGEAPVPREKLLRELWSEDRNNAKRLVEKWHSIYVESYRRIATACGPRSILVWMSDRSPSDWDLTDLDDRPSFGRFPQLVSHDVFSAVSDYFPRKVVAVHDGTKRFGFRSRFTGEKCPFIWPVDGSMRWDTDYYPSLEANRSASQLVIDQMMDIL